MYEWGSIVVIVPWDKNVGINNILYVWSCIMNICIDKDRLSLSCLENRSIRYMYTGICCKYVGIYSVYLELYYKLMHKEEIHHALDLWC